MKSDDKTLDRVYRMPFSAVYPHYVTKVEKKGRTTAELHRVIQWLTGYSDADIASHLARETSFEAFFAQAQLNPTAFSSPALSAECGSKTSKILCYRRFGISTSSSMSWPAGRCSRRFCGHEQPG